MLLSQVYLKPYLALVTYALYVIRKMVIWQIYRLKNKNTFALPASILHK